MSLQSILGLIPHEIKQPIKDSKIRQQLEKIQENDFIIFQMKNGNLRFEDEVKESAYCDIDKIYIVKTR